MEVPTPINNDKPRVTQVRVVVRNIGTEGQFYITNIYLVTDLIPNSPIEDNFSDWNIYLEDEGGLIYELPWNKNIFESASNYGSSLSSGSNTLQTIVLFREFDASDGNLLPLAPVPPFNGDIEILNIILNGEKYSMGGLVEMPSSPARTIGYIYVNYDPLS